MRVVFLISRSDLTQKLVLSKLRETFALAFTERKKEKGYRPTKWPFDWRTHLDLPLRLVVFDNCSH